MSKVTPEQLSRRAVIYVRQSTMGQVLNNPGSREWQYGLADRARALGWPEPEVIDEDLGRSGGGGVERPGFERMLGEVCRGEIGIILAVDATRLSRNGMEWHLLIDCCGLVGCLLADEQSVCDPRIPSDRLMLGVQGAVSELETSNIRRRMMEGKRRKAAQGRLFRSVPAGHVRVGKDRIEKDPDERVRSALELVFGKFDELQILRRVMHWFRAEGVELPAVVRDGTGAGVRWRPATCTRIRGILANPIHAGAYAFGRSVARTTVSEGRKRVVNRTVSRPEDREVLIKDAHEGYITWERYERNRRVTADNASWKGAEEARGAVRGGSALLAGLLRCGRCGRKMKVACSGKGRTVHYVCDGRRLALGGAVCARFGGRRADEAVGAALLRALEPVAMEAALRALDEDAEAESDAVRQAELALERARYEADRAFRQHDAVDPGSDIKRAWCHERVSPELRKRILRAALVEATAGVEDRQVRLVLHWQGGDHSETVVENRAVGRHSFATDEETATIITALARPAHAPFIP